MSPTGTRKNSRRRGQLQAEVTGALREVIMQLTLFNRHVAGRLDLKDVDHACLNLIEGHGPLSPRDLAQRAGLHPATMTGVLDRLEGGRWVARQRDPSDRRGVLVRPLRERTAEMMRLYSPMYTRMHQICAKFTDDDLERIAEFLRLTANAGRDASQGFATGDRVLEVR